MSFINQIGVLYKNINVSHQKETREKCFLQKHVPCCLARESVEKEMKKKNGEGEEEYRHNPDSP